MQCAPAGLPIQLEPRLIVPGCRWGSDSVLGLLSPGLVTRSIMLCRWPGSWHLGS